MNQMARQRGCARSRLGKESYQELSQEEKFAMRIMIAIIKNGGQLTVSTGPIVKRDRSDPSFYGPTPGGRSATAEDGIVHRNGPVPTQRA